jgi:TP901 family phage tail tape measure protein
VAVSNVELRVGATQAITALKNVNTQAQKFNQTVNGTNSKLKDANKALPILSKGFFGAGAGAKGAALGFKTAGAALMTALGPLTAGLTLVAALGKTFANLAAQDFASAKIKTLGVDADALQPKLASLSNELSGQASSLQLLSASYDVASAGFGETAELTDVLKASQLGATGGFSELATVADATTSVLNAYGLESDKAAKLVDGFIQTQNDGKIVVDQYAQQIGRLAPIAAGAGVGIEELNAAISTVTATGVPVESTFAGLRQVIAAIQKPTSEAAKAAEKLGIDFSATALSTKGLGGVLEELVAKGGASEETLAQFFGSVEARTAILPLLNDQLVSFNKNLENQAKAQGTAAEAAFTAQNTIQGQLTRLGTAFTNLTTDGSEIGIVIRESLKIAAVTVEALTAAFKLVLAPVRAIFAAVGEIGKQIGKAIGIDATKTLFNLEQGWIGIKERVTEVSDQVIFAGKVIGGVYANVYKKIFGFLKGIADGTKNIFIGIIDTFKDVVQGIVNAINGNPILKRLFGGLTNIKLDFDISGVKNFGKDFLKGAQKNLDNLKEGVLEFSGVEKIITKENNKQLDAKNKIVTTNNNLNTSLGTTKTKTVDVTNSTDDLKDKFMQIGDDIEKGIVSNLTDAVMGTKSLAEAATSVLNNLKRKLIEVSIQRAVSGIGGKIGGFLGGLFGRASGGPVSAGGAYLVGERGPEILQMGSKGGNIIPNNKIGAGTTNMVTVNVDASGSAVAGNNQDAKLLGQAIATAVQSQLIKEKRQGGLLSR